MTETIEGIDGISIIPGNGEPLTQSELEMIATYSKRRNRAYREKRGAVVAHYDEEARMARALGIISQGTFRRLIGD